MSLRDILLNSKLSDAAILAFCFVDASISAAADEANNLIPLADSLLRVVACEHLRRASSIYVDILLALALTS